MKTNFEQEKGKEKSDQDTRQSLLSLYEEIQRAKYEIDPSKKKFHSEGFNRHITCIKIGNYPYGEDALYVKELEEIGEELGFQVEVAEKNDKRLEDAGIVRHDGKIYFPQNDESRPLPPYHTPQRAEITTTEQGANWQHFQSDALYHHGNFEQKIQGKTYLEGGNVLNTITAQGAPGAIIGEESLIYSLNAMQLPDTEENRKKVKNQIATELGLDEQNIVFIPQFDFHIDMFYRPLNDGEIGVPDYETGIKYLENLDDSHFERSQKDSYIQALKELDKKSKDFQKKTIKLLQEQGYKITKIPCFTRASKKGRHKSQEINYSNGICGTTPQGEKYYITNTSGIEALDQQMREYFQSIGVDKVYFLHTQKALGEGGGIDCLTLEISGDTDKN